MGLLNKTKTYLSGSMEMKNGENWRNYVKSILEPRGVICLDPYHKKFTKIAEENEARRQELYKMREKGEYEALCREFRHIRSLDLYCCDKADFLICYIDNTVFTAGTIEELVTCNRAKAQCFVVCEQGKKNCPLWIFGMIPHECIFDSFEQLTTHIIKIDDGTIEMTGRWKLFSEEIR